MKTGGFLDDVTATGAAVRAIVDGRVAGLESGLGAAAAAISAGPHVAFVGMGSSLAAATTAIPRLHRAGRLALAVDAGELLHAGLPGLVRGAPVVLVSQSGRSAEIVRLLDVVREAGGGPLIGITNDEAGPLARAADVVVPIGAGPEANVATKTFVATLVVLHRLVDRCLGESLADGERLRPALERMADLAARPELGLGWADRLAPDGLRSIVVVARGASLGIAGYAALTLKETTRIHVEAMSGGAFRHGPLELAGPRLGAIVLADGESTRDLMDRIAGELAAAGSPTWVVDTGADDDAGADATGPRTRLGRCSLVGGQLVATTAIQLLAAGLAARRGLEAGVMVRSGKVTEIE